mmetsp:Transcript_89143/g.226738  ORF Transcript_89143/g.226738 Transcript_89143/m.226738 type:complete len:206 (-) Transcript_89143:154-771(-)
MVAANPTSDGGPATGASPPEAIGTGNAGAATPRTRAAAAVAAPAAGLKRKAEGEAAAGGAVPPRFKERNYKQTADGTAHDPSQFQKEYMAAKAAAHHPPVAQAPPRAAAPSEEMSCWDFKKGFCIKGRMCNWVHPGVSKGNAAAVGCPSAFSQGSRVQIFGLNSKPEYNERVGECEEFDMETTRWQVRLGSGVRLKLKETNLRRC